MILSFDLDDTLVTRIHNWEFEPGLPGFRTDSEFLRLGTVELFRWIRSQNHSIWIYTNSYRGFKNLSDWFLNCRIPVDFVINQVIHDEKRMEKGPGIRTDKVPVWFDIDMHFDDLDTLASEQNIFQILPDDENWAATVKKYGKKICGGKKLGFNDFVSIMLNHKLNTRLKQFSPGLANTFTVFTVSLFNGFHHRLYPY